MNLTIVNQSGRAVPRKFLEKWVRDIDRLAAFEMNAKKYRGREFVIAFVNPKTARRLNREFRGKDYATDVLSFDGDSSDSLGELVISPEVIAKQAREHGLLVREELGYMVLHGFLHLLGYDHEQGERGAKKMFTLQDRLFEKLLRAASARRTTATR